MILFEIDRMLTTTKILGQYQCLSTETPCIYFTVHRKRTKFWRNTVPNYFSRVIHPSKKKKKKEKRKKTKENARKAKTSKQSDTCEHLQIRNICTIEIHARARVCVCVCVCV